MICKRCGEYIPTNFEERIIRMLDRGIPLRSEDIQLETGRKRQQVDRALAILYTYNMIQKTDTRPRFYYVMKK